MFGENLHTRAAYRSGAAGALLDEYEKALNELIRLIKPLGEATILSVVDPDTSDPDCHSIQTGLAHVVRSGICYALDIRKNQGEPVEFPWSNGWNTLLFMYCDIEGRLNGFWDKGMLGIFYPKLPFCYCFLLKNSHP